MEWRFHLMAPNGVPEDPFPWDPLGSQGFPSHGGSGTPSHGIPWAPKGSLSHGSPPMGSLWAPKGPLPWDPPPPLSGPDLVPIYSPQLPPATAISFHAGVLH